MKIIKEIKQDEAWDHWKKVENFSNSDFRLDIRKPLPTDLQWYTAFLETPDIGKVFIISSDDWKGDHLCVSDFKLLTAMSNYKVSLNNMGKYDDIRKKEIIFKNDLNGIDTKLIFVAPDTNGPFTIIEGNKRAIALGCLGKLNNLEIFLGVSSEIKHYCWARYSI